MAAVPDTSPRRFHAFLRTKGRVGCGITSNHIEIHERTEEGSLKLRVLTLPEAGELRDELDAALRALAVGAALAADPDRASGSAAAGQQERPRPYLGPCPIRGKTLAEVDAEPEGRAA